MLDGLIRPLIDPALDALGRRMAARGVGADAVTLAGLALGLAAAGAIALGHPAAGLALILASRLADGLDGAVARAGRPTDFGGLLDIVADFLFYGAIPFAFALLDPAANAVAAAALILSFYVNGATFLGVATLAAKRGLGPGDRGPKALHYSAGLLEGTETIAFFLALCLWPAAFAPLAWGFAALCLVTAGLRMAAARAVFAETGRRAGG